MRHYVGIDYSITSPGVVVMRDGVVDFHALTSTKYLQGIAIDPEYTVDVRVYPEYRTEAERYHRLSEWVSDILVRYNNVEKICLEGYAFASKGRKFSTAENTGVLKHMIYQSFPDIRLETIPPSTVKKHATGKGNAVKDDMYSALVEKTGIDLMCLFGHKSKKKVDTPFDDLADAYWLADIAKNG